MPGVYYNDTDPGACAWLRELMTAGLIPKGEVDERSIEDIRSGELAGFHQVHLFAGVGGWAYALALAGWGDRPVWTGSCPCQPFSAAGKGLAEKDHRHLWPHMRRLVRECGPPVVFGEQAQSKRGRQWLDGVRADLEHLGYAVGAADLPAAGVGAPHIRQRLWLVADDESRWLAHRPAGGREEGIDGGQQAAGAHGSRSANDGVVGRLANAESQRAGSRRGEQGGRGLGGVLLEGTGEGINGRDNCGPGGLGDAGLTGPQGHGQPDAAVRGDRGVRGADGPVGTAGPTGWVGDTQGQREGAVGGIPGGAGAQRLLGVGFWDRYDLVPCRDGKVRRTQPGPLGVADGVPAHLAAVWAEVSRGFPLVYQKVPGRVKLLRGYGNAICPWAAAVWIGTFLEAERSLT